jgi:hypothetical protein
VRGQSGRATPAYSRTGRSRAAAGSPGQVEAQPGGVEPAVVAPRAVFSPVSGQHRAGAVAVTTQPSGCINNWPRVVRLSGARPASTIVIRGPAQSSSTGPCGRARGCWSRRRRACAQGTAQRVSVRS